MIIVATGTLLQSWPRYFKNDCPRERTVTARLSSSFCYLSHWRGLLLPSPRYSPSNILTTRLITPLISPTATARKCGRRRGGEEGVIQTSRYIHVNVSFSAWQFCLRAFRSSGFEKLLNNRSSAAVGGGRGSDIHHPLQESRPLPCHGPDQPVSLIYDLLSAVTSVKHVHRCWPSHKLRTPDWVRPSACRCSVLQGF